MTNSTQQAVIRAARECFFRHGYKTSNMSLISEYSGFSRVTVHKYLSNKDDAFKQCIKLTQLEATAECQPILQSNLECWLAIEAILTVWVRPTFEEVHDITVLRDLKFYALEVASEIFEEAHDGIAQMVQEVLDKALKNGELTLDKVHLNTSDLSNLILAGLDGIRTRTSSCELMSTCQKMIQVFKVATKPN